MQRGYPKVYPLGLEGFTVKPHNAFLERYPKVSRKGIPLRIYPLGLHQEAIARYFLFHSDFQLNRPQISKKTVTKFQKHNVPQWQSNKMRQIIIDRWQEIWTIVETRHKGKKFN